MGTTISNKRIWRIAYPIILGSIAQNFINVTDTAFLGRLGEVELGAAAIGGIFYLAIVMFGYGLGIGTQIIVARREGEGRQRSIGRVMEHSFIILIFLALAMFVMMKLFSPGFFSVIISSEKVYIASNDFIQLRAWGVFFAFINMGFNALYIGTARTGIITWSTLLMACINIFLDYVLIFGKLGFPEYGIKGAAIASFCAEISVSIFLFIYTFGYTDLKRYRLFYFQKININIWIRIIRISLPVMLQNFLSFGVWFVFFVFVEQMGETSLAVSNIIRSVYVIMMVPIWGFASASNTLVSYLIGRGRDMEVLPLIFKTAWLCFLMVMAFVSLIILMPDQIIRVYTTDADLVAASLPVLNVVSGAVLCFAFAMVFFYGLSGTGVTQATLVIELLVVTVYLFVAYLLTNVYELSVSWVWTVEFLYASGLFILSFLYLRYGNWRVRSGWV
ncbi:MAG: MATE family efflux transporter [Bacteroidales bacterium]